MKKTSGDDIDKKTVELADRFDNVIDDGWIVKNNFSNWIPSLFYNRENQRLVINLENLEKDSVVFNYKDSNLVISAIDSKQKRGKNRLKPEYIKRIYNLETPVLANNIYIKYKDGNRYLKNMNRSINLSFIRIEINMPSYKISRNIYLQ